MCLPLQRESTGKETSKICDSSKTVHCLSIQTTPFLLSIVETVKINPSGVARSRQKTTIGEKIVHA